jgi:hypothetical protein
MVKKGTESVSLNFSKRMVLSIVLIGLFCSFNNVFSSIPNKEEETTPRIIKKRGPKRNIKRKKIDNLQTSPKSRKVVYLPSPKSRAVAVLLSPLSCLGIPDFYLGKYKAGLIKLSITVGLLLPELLLKGKLWKEIRAENSDISSSKAEEKVNHEAEDIMDGNSFYISAHILAYLHVFGTLMYTLIKPHFSSLKDGKGRVVL